jgi:hypothetical protein
MSVDVNAVAAQVLAAMQGKVSGLTGAPATALETAAGTLAKSLADIEAYHLAGSLTDAEAADLVSGATDDAMSVLVTTAGMAALDLKGAVTAGLMTLVQVALSASGLGWAGPVIQSVITAFAQTGS